MPSTSNRWQRIRDLFEAVRELSAEDRSTRLADECEDDAGLRTEVESLLDHDSQAPPDFLKPPDPPPRSNPTTDPDDPDPLRLIGRDVGGFTVKRLIAAGGMGVVYLAEQNRPRRAVALKVMRAGIASGSALRRFEYESEILGRLRHPNIAHIHAVGTIKPEPDADHPGGAPLAVPYFAMEYVPDAAPITHYADQNKLDVRRRLELFAQVCDAVHHGHTKSVIHRDLKPANILIDAAGTAKIIDFGIARSTDADLAMTTATHERGSLIGTIQYMSPEQCAGGPEHDVDTRGDVYSLGVVLYEMLCGRLPYDLTRAPLPVAARVICEQPPTPPSQLWRRRSAGRQGTGAPSLPGVGDRRPRECDQNRETTNQSRDTIEQSRNRKGAVDEHVDRLHRQPLPHGRGSDHLDRHPPRPRDLECILLKALEKNRDQRYQSAADLRRDIHRYLAGEPTEARLPTAWTRALRWAARYPKAVTAAASFMLGVACILGYMKLQAAREAGRADVREDARAVLKVSEANDRVWIERPDGELVRQWTSKQPGAFAFAHLEPRPHELGGERIAVLGFGPGYAEDIALAGRVWGFDRHGRGKKPIPFEPLTDELVPAEMLAKNRPADLLNPEGASLVADIFPELPGEELVVVYDLGPWSQSALCVYDLSGSLIYCIWQNGGIHHLYWLPAPGLLICLGADEQAKERVPYNGLRQKLALVLFAIRPRAGHKVAQFIGNQAGKGPSRPLWYKFLRPATLRNAITDGNGKLLVVPPRDVRAHDPKRFFSFNLLLATVPGKDYRAGVSWIIDEHGEEVTGTRVVSDGYKRDQASSQPALPPRKTVEFGEAECTLGPLAETAIEPPPPATATRPSAATPRP